MKSRLLFCILMITAASWGARAEHLASPLHDSDGSLIEPGDAVDARPPVQAPGWQAPNVHRHPRLEMEVQIAGLPPAISLSSARKEGVGLVHMEALWTVAVQKDLTLTSGLGAAVPLGGFEALPGAPESVLLYLPFEVEYGLGEGLSIAGYFERFFGSSHRHQDQRMDRTGIRLYYIP